MKYLLLTLLLISCGEKSKDKGDEQPVEAGRVAWQEAEDVNSADATPSDGDSETKKYEPGFDINGTPLTKDGKNLVGYDNLGFPIYE